MNENLSLKTRIYITVTAAILTWSLLGWNYFHGGVPSHHILNRKDLPAISNWWGAALFPLLTWILLYRIRQRLRQDADKHSNPGKSHPNIIYGFIAALLFAVSLSTFFTLGNQDVPGYILMAILIIAFFYPIYYSECLLGFVTGMTFTFGAILPTAVGCILALMGAVIYLFVRRLILYVVSGIARKSK